MNIAVISGGLSPERNVSLSSASLISSALRRKGHRVLMIDIYEGIEELPNEPLSLFSSELTDALSVGQDAPSSSDLNAIRSANGNRREMIGPNVLTLCKQADVAFLALHGDMGENGQLQATLDVFDIAYTGSGYLGSALAMNKDVAKRLMRQSGVLTPDWLCFNIENNNDMIGETIKKIGFPCIVKPCSCGSSVGVSIVENENELQKALSHARAYESSVIIEKRIFGKEITQAFVDGVALPPVEIIPKSGFYNYTNKYVENATKELCPAPLSDELLKAADSTTQKCFEVLHLSDYARIDYIIDAENKLWCLEANTLPGMTPTSLLPQEAAAVGIDYDSLCEKIAIMALSKRK